MGCMTRVDRRIAFLLAFCWPVEYVLGRSFLRCGEGELMQVRSISVVSAMVAGLLLSGSVHAASITWGNVQNISGPGSTTVSTIKQGGPGSNQTITNGTNDVSTLGTQVFGLNYSGAPGSTFPYDTIINGQTFYSFRDASNVSSVSYSAADVIKPYASFGPPGAAGQSYGNSDSGGVGPNPDYTMANAVFSDTTSGTITFGNLTAGNTYLLQFWVSDPRGGILATRIETLTSSTGGDSNVPTLAYEGPGSIDGQWVIGTFVADASGTESLLLAASNTNSGDGGSAQVNLLQLRDITSVPEPASIGLTGLGVLGLLVRRRRA
jgi:hypothetical protein